VELGTAVAGFLSVEPSPRGIQGQAPVFDLQIGNELRVVQVTAGYACVSPPPHSSRAHLGDNRANRGVPGWTHELGLDGSVPA